MQSPRGFVQLDVRWKADLPWPDYFLTDKLWGSVDEYRPDLIGDEDYCRTVIHAGKNWGCSIYRSDKKDGELFSNIKWKEMLASSEKIFFRQIEYKQCLATFDTTHTLALHFMERLIC
jgi:hypothetical protein